MEKMTAEQYVSERLDDQIAWYDRKSGWNQKWFKRWQLTQIIAAAVIPFLSGMDSKTPLFDMEIKWTMMIGLLGMLVAIATAAIALYKFQENWVQYRTTAEQLRYERFLFLTGVSPYHDSTAFELLVKRIENIISKEASQWAQAAQEKTSNKPSAEAVTEK